MSQQDNLRVIHEAFEAWNAHDVDRYAALLGEGYVEETHTMPGSVRGREAARTMMRVLAGLARPAFRPRCHGQQRGSGVHAMAGHRDLQGRVDERFSVRSTCRGLRLYSQQT